MGEKFESVYGRMREDIERGARKFDGFTTIIEDLVRNFTLIKDLLVFNVDPAFIELRADESCWVEYILKFGSSLFDCCYVYVMYLPHIYLFFCLYVIW